MINAAGQTAFSAVLKGREIDSSNDFGIFAQDRAGALQLIARTGSSLEVAPGDFRTIRSLSFADRTGNEDGLHSGFNDHGQLAFFAVFTDDTSGIFVSNLVAVPEPSSLLLVAAAIVTLVAKMIR